MWPHNVNTSMIAKYKPSVQRTCTCSVDVNFVHALLWAVILRLAVSVSSKRLQQCWTIPRVTSSLSDALNGLNINQCLLLGFHVACSAKISVDTHTHSQTTLAPHVHRGLTISHMFAYSLYPEGGTRLDPQPPVCLCIKTELCHKETLKSWLDKNKDRSRVEITNWFVEVH